MSTESALEQISQGDFQRLANAVLAANDLKYRALLETGGNARGQTIRAAADAMCWVPFTNPPHLVVAEHTTTELSSLPGKWLHAAPDETRVAGSREEGDLIKAARRIAALRPSFSGMQATVVLTSTRRVGVELQNEVQQVAERLGVAVDVWDQSRLTRYLDHDKDGHWLRYLYLGISAQRLSADLLRDLCRRSLEAYRNSFEFPHEDEGKLIVRELESRLRQSDQGGRTLRCLVGPPGYGKSTLLWQLLTNRLESGGFALWLSPEHWGHTTLAGAVESQLRDLYPSLVVGEGERALEIASKANPLWVAVDDINRLPSATDALHRIRSWGRPAPQSNPESSYSPSSAAVWLPLWPQNWAIIDTRRGEARWAEKFDVDNYTSAESTALLAQVPSGIQQSEWETITSQLGRDPFTIGLVLDSLGANPEMPAEASARSVVGWFIDRQCESAARQDSQLLSADFRSALWKLVREMLFRRNLRPTWGEVTNWFQGEVGSDEVLPPLRALARVGNLCRFGIDNRWQFRHDRIHNALSAEAIAQELEGAAEAAIPEEWRAVLAEPFYAEIVGEALAQLSQAAWQSLGALITSLVAQENPLALAVALRWVSQSAAVGEIAEPHQANRAGEIRRKLIEWAQGHQRGEDDLTGPMGADSQDLPGSSQGPRVAPWSLRRAIYEVLLAVDHREVAEVGILLPNDHFRGLFLLTYGLTSHAVYRTASECFGSTYPSITHAANLGKLRHKERLRLLLREELAHLPELVFTDHLESMGPGPGREIKMQLHGAISLMGYLRLENMEDVLRECWRQVPNEHRKEFLSAFIWSAVLGSDPIDRGPEQDYQFLTELMVAWEELSDERMDKAGGMSERSWIAEELSQAFRQKELPCPTRAIQFLIRYAEQKTGMTRAVRWALSSLDSPDAMEFMVRCAIRDYQKSSFVHWVHDFPRHWDGTFGDKRCLSPATRERLITLWRDESLDNVGRILALRLWCSNLGNADLSTLAEILPDSCLFETSLELRAVNGDRTCVPQVVEAGGEDDIYLQYVRHVWCPELLPLVHDWTRKEKELGGKYDSGMSGVAYMLFRLLIHIPESAAEEVLDEHWSHFRQFGCFIQIALWVGTPRCLELAHGAIEDFPDDEDPFAQGPAHLPVSLPVVGEPDLPERIYRFVRNASPYLLRMSDKNRAWLAQGCCRIGQQSWGRVHIGPFLTPSQRAQYFPEPCDRIQEVAAILERARTGRGNRPVSKDAPILVHIWLEDNERWHVPAHLAVGAALEWLEAEPNEERVWIALAAVGQAGNRTHLSRLERAMERISWGEYSLREAQESLDDCSNQVRRRSLT